MEKDVHTRESERLGTVRDRRDNEDTTCLLGKVLGSRELFLTDSKNKSFLRNSRATSLKLLGGDDELLGAAVEEGDQVVVVACLDVV